MLICGVVLLFTGHHHHEHDHGLNKMLSQLDSRFTGLWSFMLGIFFAIAFCPHRLVYFVTMVDMAVTQPIAWSWLMPFVFAIGTGLPVIVIAWIICYSAVSIGNLTNRLSILEKWFRYICAVLFIGLGIYMGIRTFLEHDLGVKPEIADEEACLMEHVLSGDTMQRLIGYLERQGVEIPKE